jgi:hypothetical protein
MSEIRRKLVIVGDGACGKVSITPYIDPGQVQCTEMDMLTKSWCCAGTDLLVDRLLERNFP